MEIRNIFRDLRLSVVSFIPDPQENRPADKDCVNVSQQKADIYSGTKDEKRETISYKF